ncbi:uncharacterized protein EI90DRAFT_2881623, partial [Cantharellus anzutake]|uniref:uncharacterized protein n=1 Tax=Cantharellus anzutake TaxID=1750568 RepID=UPI001906866A
MGLYLGLIRLAIVLSNVYWSFKSLKPPRLSRRGDAPTARAIAARKREIKACLSVWIIWGCWIHAERVCDRSIGILIPFYEDMKAIFLSVFFLCRAAVAEPILLYFLRPLIKPYIVTIDWSLDIFTFFAGLITYLLCLPYRYVRTW